MPTPPTAPIRVAECRRCGQLFAVYAATGEVACPACEATASVASLQIVELGVAAPVELKVESVQAAPTPVEIQAPPVEPTAPAGPVAAEHLAAEHLAAEHPAAEATAPEREEPKRPPTVAEWLLQSEQLSAPTPALTEAKRSLAESLGWKPGAFEVPSPAAERDESRDESRGWPAEQGDGAADEAPPLAASLADFRFDFGATPLSEHVEPSSEPEELESRDADGVSLELTTPAEDAPQPLSLEALTKSAPHSRGWGNFVGMAIGLMLVAGPAAYLAVTWNSDEAAFQLASLDDRLLSDNAPAETSSDPVESRVNDVAPPRPFAAADPFVDSSTKPAGFDGPPASFDKAPASFDRPPASFEKAPADFDNGGADEPEFQLPSTAPTELERPAPSNVDPSSVDPLQAASDSPAAGAPMADPFLAPAPEFAATQPSRTTAPTGADRYGASQAPAEPAPFAAPEETIDPMVSPVAAIAEPRAMPMAPPTPSTGLVNAPRYGARDLADAFAPAEAAAFGFSTGSLDDPAQVSTMGQYYAQLCHLAQVLTLLDVGDPSLTTAELQAAETFKRLLRDERSRVQSRQIAGPWIAWTGRPHGGVFFAGVPEDVQRAGEVMQYEFRIGESVVPIVMAQEIDASRFAHSAEVGVIGLVVENPREWIAGYRGDAQRVVWARKTLPLPRAEEL